MADKVKNQIIVLEPSTKSVTDLLAQLKEKDTADIVVVNTQEEALAKIVGALPCLFITSLLDNKDVPARVQTLKRLENCIKHQGLKVYMVTGIKNRQLSDLFTQKMGVTDYIVDPVPVRTMVFKVNLALKAVDNFRKQQEMKKAASEQIVIKKFEGKKSAEAAAEVASKGKPALQMAEDTFLFKNGGAKKAGKKFVLEVEGPDPSTGEWQQHEDKGDAKSAWRWVPNEEKDAQAKGAAPADGWVHEGDKPTFKEESGKWAMSSENPALALQVGGKKIAEKIGLDDKGELVIAEDSPAAEENLRKNKVKAAEAIKAREERQKILADKKKAIDKANLDETKNGILAEIAEGAEEEATLLPGVGPAAARKKAKGKAEKGGIASLQETMNTVEADESDEPSEFNNKLDGKKEVLRSVEDKRDLKADALKSLAAEGKEEAAVLAAGEEKKASALDFLKKKKEQLQGAALATNVNTLKADAPLKGANALKEGDEETGPSAGILNRKEGKKKPKSAIDKLARLKAGLADDEDEEEEASEAFSSLAADDEGEKETAIAARAGKGEDARKDGPKIKLKAEEAKKGSPRLKLQEKKKKTLEAIQDKLLQALPEEMTPEEEEEVRKELGLEGRPEIKPKELARKKRLADVKKMKDLLGELDNELAKEDGEIISQDPGQRPDEKVERRKGDLNEEKLKGIRGAIDNGDDALSEDEPEERKKLRKDELAERKSAGLDDKSLYMPEAELTPPGNAWESTGRGFVYLNAETRYKGFETLEQLLPIWVFKGDKIPELLGKTKQWRFRGSLPTQVKTASEIPADVREYLLGIRDQLKANGVGADAEEEPGKPEEGRKASKEKGKGAASALDRLKAELGGDHDAEEAAEEEAEESAAEDGADDERAPAGGKGKFKEGKELARPGEELNDLKARKQKALAAALDEEEPEEEESAGDEATEAKAKGKGKTGKPKKGAAAAGLDMLARLRDKANGSAAETPEEEEAREELEAEEAAEELSAERGEEAEDAPAADRMAQLRSQLEMTEESAEDVDARGRKMRREAQPEAPEDSEEEETAAEAALPPEERKKAAAKKKSDKMDRLREQLGEELSSSEDAESAEPAAKKARAEATAATEDGSEQVSAVDPESEEAGAAAPGGRKEPSAGVKKFMERRKAKALKEKAARVAGPASAVSVYLGIYVSLSDSLAQETASGVAVPRVLKAFEVSFGNCTALCTATPDDQNFADVRFGATGTPEAISRVQLSSGIFEAITSDDGSNAEVLGYLFLQADGSRTSFDEAETSTLQKIARKLWPLLKRDALNLESKAA